MTRRTEIAAPAAAAVVVMTATLGGGFFPVPRLLVGGALLMVWMVVATETQGRPDWSERWMVVVLLWGLVSAVWVGASPLASKEALTVWMVAAALWAISRRCDELSRKRGLRILVMGAAAIAAAVVVQAVFERSFRVGGFLENPNLAAALLVPTAALGWQVLESDPNWRRWTWLGLMGIGIVLTGSRAGMMAGIVVIAILMPRGPVRIAGTVAGCVVAFGALSWRFVSQPDILAWHRVSIWKAVLKIWATRPVTGIGPGSLVEAAGPERILHSDHVGRYQFIVGYAESTPLAMLVQVGLVGVVLFGLAAGSWWVIARRSNFGDSRPALASLAAVVVLSLFHDFLTSDPVLLWWAVLLGCVVGIGRQPPDVTGSRLPSPSRTLLFLSIAWFTAWGIMSPAFARWTWFGGEPSTAQAIRALRIEPWFSVAPAQRVSVYLSDPERWDWETAGEALQWAQTAKNVHPGLARRWADLGRVHLRILTDLGGTDHDIEAARKALDHACELDPHLPWHLLERARLERILENGDAAIRFTRKALEEEPNTIQAWLTLGRLELEQGRVDAAQVALVEIEGRRDLADRSGLSEYDRELLEAPDHEIRRLRRALGSREWVDD